MHHRNESRLFPKALKTFSYNFKYGERGAKYDSGITYGSSQTNAVIRHQLNQEGFPTSGVSTTPKLERAKIYAQGPYGKEPGVVYRIDRISLDCHKVKQYVVAEYAKFPSVPEDEEVILVSADCDPLPADIVAEVIKVENS